MNIASLQALIPASFEYTDAITAETATINLQLKRMSFKATASKQFREAMDNEDTDAISKLLADLIAEWDITLGDDPFTPSAENIAACPAEFVGKLAECVFARLFPNQTRAANSPDGSEQAENTASATTSLESDSSLPKPVDIGE